MVRTTTINRWHPRDPRTQNTSTTKANHTINTTFHPTPLLINAVHHPTGTTDNEANGEDGRRRDVENTLLDARHDSQHHITGPRIPRHRPKEDLLKAATSSTVNNPKDAVKRLRTWKLITAETPTLADLSYALLYTLSTQPNPSAVLTDGIKAVALLLDHPENLQLPATTQNEDTVIETRHEANTENNPTENVTTRVERIEATLTGVEQTMIELLAAFKDRQNTLQAPAAPLPPLPLPPQHNAYTYAMAAKSRTPPPQHAAVISRSHSLRKQILITKSDTESNDPLRDLDEQQIIIKANVAFELIPENDEPKPRNFKFLCAKRLRNGDVLLDLNTEESAKWIRSSHNTAKFLQQFGAMTKIKDRSHNIIVEFAPLTLDVDQPHQIAIAIGNDIPHDEIHQARWIKHKEKRKPNQHRGHLILSTKTAEGANLLIDEGVLIGGRRLRARKLRKESMRCHRCQAIGKHYARDCKLPRNVCGTCAGDHWTSTCNIQDDQQFQCNNCRHDGREYKGHAAWDIERCPAMRYEQEKSNRKHPDNLYRFFVTADENTWEMVDPDEPPYRLTPRQPEADNDPKKTTSPQTVDEANDHHWLLSSPSQPHPEDINPTNRNNNQRANDRYSPSQPIPTPTIQHTPTHPPPTRTSRPPTRSLIQTTLSFTPRPDSTPIHDDE